MGLLAPLGLGLLALLAPVIAMYLLKRRREEVAVSSTFLWERVVQDMEANAPWQRLRRNLLLLLQLLFLLLVILAAARPFLRTVGAASESLILIVDGSISMAASDVEGGSRLEAARREALRLTEQLPPDGRVTVIRAGAGAEVLIAATRDRVAVAQALERVTPSAADSDVSAALNLAAAVAARQPESEIVLLSDGAVTAPTRVGLERALRYIPIGESGNNQAVSALNLRPQGQGYSLFVQVTNYGNEAVSRRLALAVNGAPYAAFDLELAAGERAERVVDGLPATTGEVQASLDGQDTLLADDSAWAVPPAAGQRTVRLVTAGNVFLRAGLGLLPGVQLTLVAPSETVEVTDTVGVAVTGTVAAPTLTVLDRVITDAVALAPGSDGALLLIAPPAPLPSLGITVTGVISQPVPVPASPEDPLLRYVDLSDVAIARAQQVVLPDWARPAIVDANSGAPLLWIGETGGRQVALLAFDLHASDLVLRVAFPLLLANVVDALVLGPTGSLIDQPTLGQPVPLPLPPEATAVEIQQPDGRVARLRPDDGEPVFVPEQLGLHQVRWPGTDLPPAAFAVNLFNPQESNVAPASQLALDPAEGAAAGGTPRPLTEEGRQEYWRPLALVALAVLLVEWLVSQRDARARLAGWWRARRVRAA
ncbi:MAG TPA: VWA domain-containing protein [Ardenticatenaceae bacterium]|nr:VWA domain-containing protein [Ardenticatenaceae bacterium]